MKTHKAWMAAGVAVGLSVAGPSMAATSTGTITNYHLNSGVEGRGVCVRMAPGLPGTGWACLWKTNALYSEITAMLLQGLVNNRTCAITWSTSDPHGHNLITMAECY